MVMIVISSIFSLLHTQLFCFNNDGVDSAAMNYSFIHVRDSIFHFIYLFLFLFFLFFSCFLSD